MCLIWVIPMRDLLPLLKRHPQLYHKACSQLVPKVLMDYLTISPLTVSFPYLAWAMLGPGGRCVSVSVL
jgi:hypothetical protein